MAVIWGIYVHLQYISKYYNDDYANLSIMSIFRKKWHSSFLHKIFYAFYTEGDLHCASHTRKKFQWKNTYTYQFYNTFSQIKLICTRVFDQLATGKTREPQTHDRHHLGSSDSCEWSRTLSLYWKMNNNFPRACRFAKKKFPESPISKEKTTFIIIHAS